MVYFDSDYMAGCHPEIMERLRDTNLLCTPGYGTDKFCVEAKEIILQQCGLTHGNVFFLVGGTQTNTVVIDRLLDRNDGVIAAETGHINVHESGAIEATGHKILSLPSHEGKLDATEVDEYLTEFYADETNEHMVRPSMVYISYPTELGTLYSRTELEKLNSICKKWELPLFIDGARLAYGLAASKDLTLKDFPQLCDVFYIGGTKCGTLFGEAVVTKNPDILPRFNSLMKLHGALLAKGRLLGVQFGTLFANDLYQRIGNHGVSLAMKLKDGMTSKGYRLFIDSPTNQQFFVMPNDKIDSLKENVSFELWGAKGIKETPVRFVTSWNTTEEDIDTLLRLA